MKSKITFIKLLACALAGVFLSFTLVYIYRDPLFGTITRDYLFLYSLLNFCLSVVSLVLSSVLIVILGQFTSLRVYITIFLLAFFFTAELIIILVLYDQLTWLGIYVKMGDCPWKHLRLFLTVVFILTYLSVYRAYGNIERIIKNRTRKTDK